MILRDFGQFGNASSAEGSARDTQVRRARRTSGQVLGEIFRKLGDTSGQDA